MSDSEGDFSDELLELAGATEKKRRKRQSSNHSNKKAKSNVSMGSDESDRDVDSEDDLNPFPLEGKYVDEADRERLLEMTEIEREEILASRMEQLQRKQDSKNLDALLKAQKAGADGSDSIVKAAKRQHAARGATKEKSSKLDELKAKRRAKEQKKRTRTNSPKGDRDSSPMDMETSSGEEEDGQISKFEEDDDMLRKFSRKSKDDNNDEPITRYDLMAIRVSRDMLARHCLAPWFEDYVKGAWVRYLIGNEKDGQPVYRICEISGLAMNLTKPYKINDTLIDRAIELKHGKSVRAFNMDKVSNSDFPEKEWDRLKYACLTDHVAMPTRRAIEKKKEQMARLVSQRMTDSDITAMLARKNQLSSGVQSAAAITMERSRLNQARTLALRRQDAVEVAEIDVKLAALPEVAATRVAEEDDLAARLLKVNERNRKANMEAVRKAELLEAERKRKERKLANANGSGVSTPVDPSARLRTIPKMFSDQSRDTSVDLPYILLVDRSGTPNANGTPQVKAEKDALRPVSPLPPSALSGTPAASDKPKSFQASVIDSVEVDLGDF
ncbi:plus-3-domain-containing protein [Coniophora puteana RWD-64-598 SS2]|uniref:Plus-3-domain-containing protein n=1 Tax=Coniophora puteana (strain RWD-64-598) TaxID=741705 RepID=A0A5M3ML07_CONPW|nr:plus-3-domain-containing protein [Coniophora puteana RWD-64-598 SS2]EIW79650.1 plus-3-domain-containing protein [Coniophora puteana RWD-64-598 SS2]